ncbi:MAG: sensor histidine kinase [Hespellia sp.]|nr:sensor histidine kinase [Hespellia sp.]
MELLCFYLKQKKKIFLSYLLFCFIFSFTFYLYHLPVKAVIYPFFICGLFGFIFIFIDFIRFIQKHSLLQSIEKSPANLIDKLPQISTIEDRDYQNIIRLLCEEQNFLQTTMNNKYTDMIQYYTVWVHQIKTPIASMHLSLQNEDTALSRKLSGELSRIEQYVEMVLMFLRLNSNTTDYVIKEYPIDPMIKQSIKRFASEFIEKKISLIYEPINYHVITDEKWLSFVLEQVLSNALKYTKKGYIKIYMTENNVLCIEDSGIGIAPEDLPRIFENGYTGYTGRAEKKASGIGLYLCKTICSRLNHNIFATSKLNKGTTIHINLSQFKLDTA